MARRLRYINEPATITEWTDAMLEIVKVHEVVSWITELSIPTQKVWVQPEICNVTSLSLILRLQKLGR